jgi:hypothetical protein
MWDLLGSAAQLHAVPILIARRLPDWTFTFMKLVGGFAARSTKMIFPPGLDTNQPLSDLPTVGQSLRELGFHTDVDFIDEPLPRHRALWTGALSDDLALMHTRFLFNVDQILNVAYEEDLARDNINVGKLTKRGEIVDEFIADLRARYRLEGIKRAEAEREAAEIAALEMGEDPLDFFKSFGQDYALHGREPSLGSRVRRQQTLKKAQNARGAIRDTSTAVAGPIQPASRSAHPPTDIWP